MMNHHHLGGRAGGMTAHVPLDKGQRHIDGGSHPSGGPDIAISYKDGSISSISGRGRA
jgi:hypothetical protein